MDQKLLVIILSLGAILGCVNADAEWTWDDETPLDRFVNDRTGFDPNNYDVLAYYNNSLFGCHSYVLNFTSGAWMDNTYSTQPVWWHYLTVNLPLSDNINSWEAGTVFIEGGGMGGPPGGDDEFTIGTCIMTGDSGSVSAVLKQIPNQDIRFMDDPLQEDRGEDDLIAYTWREFILLHDTVEEYVEADFERILQFPMARGSVYSLDVIAAFTNAMDSRYNIDRFAVSGGSKRGWAAWLVAALDRRVELAVPLVISILNLTTNLHHHYENLGDWTFAFGDYWAKNITTLIDDPRTQLLADQIDPYCFRPRLTMVKVIGCATGDEFFQPDDSYNFYSDLPDPKYMLMMENAEHSLLGSYARIIKNLGSIWYAIFTGFPLPTINWIIEEDEFGGSITVNTDTIPAGVVAWQGDSVPEERRDFRIIALDGLQLVYWNVSDEQSWEALDDFTYKVSLNRSDDSPYRGFLMNLYFNGPDPERMFEFTTEVNIIPQVRPFPPCVGAACQGSLI